MNAQEDRLRRCDRCGQPAKFQVLISKDGLELLFCQHHASKHGRVLDEHYPILPVAAG